MSSVELKNGKVIGDYLKPYFIAELNTSHFGDLEIAKRMILMAKEAGCDCVKFQSWSADTLYSDFYYKQNPIAKRMVDKFSLDNSQLKELSHFANSINIDFASTPYSLEEAKFLVYTCNVPFLKVASMELNNIPYLQQLANLNVPLVLSTGMGTMNEIREAVEAIESCGCEKIIILHCTSVYPSPPNLIRLKNILGIRSELPKYPIGYSDHSTGIAVPIAAISLGACVIEKHFTLDSSRIGMDNQMATEPQEMQKMIQGCLTAYSALGETERVLSEVELDMAKKMRRSLVAKNDIAIGTELTIEEIDAKRPGDMIPPNRINSILGKKTSFEIKRGEPFNFDLLS